MDSSAIRKKFLDFYANKGHAIVSSCGLIPDNDPTTLFVSAGMQQMVPYLLGETHPLGRRVANTQRCLRTQDIDEVGDNRHTTFFEMLGNWSLNDYFKEEQLAWVFEFLIKEIGLDPKKLCVTVFRGMPESGIARDDESAGIWKKLFSAAGIEAKDVDFAERDGMRDGRIFYYDETKNWWSRSGTPGGMPEGEPGGPDSEIFFDFGAEKLIHEHSRFANQPCHPNCDCGRFLEIGNSVFMEYVKRSGRIEKMPTRNVDFGGGLERMAAASLNDSDVFKTDLLKPIIEKIEAVSKKTYGGDEKTTAAMRVIADHIRAATFMVVDGALPSNKAQGYFTRRLIRRAVVKGHQLGIDGNFLADISKTVCDLYESTYGISRGMVGDELDREESRFRKTLADGLKDIKLLKTVLVPGTMKNEDGYDIPVKLTITESIVNFFFNLYQSKGMPLELVFEELDADGVDYDKETIRKKFQEKLKQHQEQSRTTSAGMFKGGLADAGIETTKLHTAAHLMLAALRKVLGDGVSQKGSNINAERLRFDFSYPQKLTQEQIKRVEDLVNEQIEKNVPVDKIQMALEDAKKSGATGAFEDKYATQVTVYGIGDFSREICGGPHVENTGVLGTFKIIKEESAGAGIRRIKAVLLKKAD